MSGFFLPLEDVDLDFPKERGVHPGDISNSKLFGASVAEAFSYNPIRLLTKQSKLRAAHFAPGRFSSEEVFGQRPGRNVRLERYDEITATEDLWRQSRFFDDEIDFYDGMTWEAARILKQTKQMEKERNLIIANSKSGFIAGSIQFAGAIVGEVPNPVNYVPFIGPATKLKYAAKIGQVLRRGAKPITSTVSSYRIGNIMGRAILNGTEAGISVAAEQPFVFSLKRSVGEQVDERMAVFNVAAAFGIGSTLTVAGRALSKFKDSSKQKMLRKAVADMVDEGDEGVKVPRLDEDDVHHEHPKNRPVGDEKPVNSVDAKPRIARSSEVEDIPRADDNPDNLKRSLDFRVQTEPPEIPRSIGPEIDPVRMSDTFRGRAPRVKVGEKSFILDFASDIDRAAYLVASPRKTKNHAQYVGFVQDASGKTEMEITNLGRQLRAQVADKVRVSKAKTGATIRIDRTLKPENILSDQLLPTDRVRNPRSRTPFSDNVGELSMKKIRSFSQPLVARMLIRAQDYLTYLKDPISKRPQFLQQLQRDLDLSDEELASLLGNLVSETDEVVPRATKQGRAMIQVKRRLFHESTNVMDDPLAFEKGFNEPSADIQFDVSRVDLAEHKRIRQDLKYDIGRDKVTFNSEFYDAAGDAIDAEPRTRVQLASNDPLQKEAAGVQAEIDKIEKSAEFERLADSAKKEANIEITRADQFDRIDDEILDCLIRGGVF